MAAAAAVLSPVLQGNDSIQIAAGAPHASNEFHEATSMAGSELLVARMSSVLQSLGYDGNAINKVGGRVTGNIVASKVDLGSPSTSSIPDIGKLLDTDLLDREKLRARNLYLNSNEPILLLEIPASSDKNAAELHQLKDDFIELLRVRSIRPVRVYVREVASLEALEFGFCLLNVVNTDIGGPSMVQLLDAAFHDESWKQDLIVKEAYDGHNLLWRDEVVARHSDKSSTPTVQPLADASIEDEHLSENETISVDKPVLAQGTSETKSTAEADVDEIADEPEENEKFIDEHPAMTELRQWESARQEIQHPTWSRDQDEDLLDIIKTHSSSVRDEEPIAAEPVSEAASDDFELVNKV